MTLLAGIDLGTTGCRCMLFDEALCVRGEEYYEYPLLNLPPDFIEQDAELWWTLLCRALKGAAQKGGVDLRDVVALSISSQGITVVPVDEAFRPLYNAINWLDRRAGTEGDEIIQAIGLEAYQKIAYRLSPSSYGLTKVLWLRQHRPEIFDAAYQFLMPMDFLIGKFCGVAVTDPSMAAGMGCYDMEAQGWSKDMLEGVGIPAARLARIAHSGSVAGRVNAKAAAECGLAEGTIVAVGSQDQKCGGVGAGLTEGVATASLGTCLATLLKIPAPMLNKAHYQPCFPDVFGEGYLLEGCAPIGAGCLKWYRDLYYPTWSYDQVVELAAQHSPGETTPMFFPHLCGAGTPKPFPDAHAMFGNVSIATDAPAMAYSVLEAVAFALRQNVEASLLSTDADILRLRVFGGGAKSDFWLQMMSDVTSLPMESLYTHEIACVGAAILAGIAAGVFASQEDAQQRCIQVAGTHRPDAGKKALYDARYAAYNAMEDRIFGA